jgi:predicted dehydrogenase
MPGLGQEIEVRAVVDPSARSLKYTREFAPDARVYGSHRELVRDPAIDWVFVGSWNCLHREHAVAALEAGKHVFCEKPMATTLEDCLAIRNAWRASGRVFSLGFVLRYSAHYQAVRELILSGGIGRVMSMEFNETLHYEHGGFIHGDWRRRRALAGTHLLEKCCHDLDLVNWILGSVPTRAASFGGLSFFRPENAHYVEKLGPHPNGQPAFQLWGRPEPGDPFGTDKDIIDNQVAIVEYANGVRATFHTNCLTAIPERRMYICGTEGTIRADVLTGVIEHRRIGHAEELRRVEGASKGGHGGADGILRQNLRDCIVEGAAPLADPEDGVSSAIAAFGIDQAMDTAQVVDLAPMWEKAGMPPQSRSSVVPSPAA